MKQKSEAERDLGRGARTTIVFNGKRMNVFVKIGFVLSLFGDCTGTTDSATRSFVPNFIPYTVHTVRCWARGLVFVGEDHSPYRS